MALTIIERNVQLDLYDHDLTPSKIKAIALDSKTRYVGAEIHNGGQTYDVGQNTGVTLTIIRPDKTGVQVTGETFQYTVGDGETVYGAYAELTQTALAVSGTLLAQFMLTSGDQILRTEIFTIANGVALDATVSEWAGEYQGYNLDELVQNVNEAVAKVDAMEQDVSELKSGLSESPSVKDSDAENVDLDVSDANGNVIVRFEGGHIKTKNFDSSQINADSDTEVMSQITDGDADLYIADAQGKGLVRFADGHIQTAEFTSDNGIYKKVFEYTDTAGTATINHFFPKGTKLAFHLVMADVAGWGHIANYNVTYKYTGRNGVVHALGSDYGYNFPTYIIPEDAVSVSVAYGTGLTQHVTKDLAFCAYSEASFAKRPKVITVSPDGSKDFTTIRGAVDSIPIDVCEMNPYELHVYPGTYDILADYTAEEIGVEGFKGLFLNNGTSLIGIGQRDEIVLTASMDTDIYDRTKRNDVSTLNIYGNVHVENVVINAENIRYAVHDEGSMMTHKFNVHSFKNVKFCGTGLASNNGNTTYGAGCSSNKQVRMIDCDFTDVMGMHSQYSLSHEISFYMENCSAKLFRFTDYENANAKAHVIMRNCKASAITIGQTTAGQAQSMTFEGVGECDALIKCPTGYVYNFGCNREFYNMNIGAGYAVKMTALDTLAVATVKNQIYGISIGTRDGNTVIQTSGYINSNTLGLTGLAVGDYLTIDNTGKVVSGGTVDNAVAVVKMVDSDNVAYAKLMI